MRSFLFKTSVQCPAPSNLTPSWLCEEVRCDGVKQQRLCLVCTFSLTPTHCESKPLVKLWAETVSEGLKAIRV